MNEQAGRPAPAFRAGRSAPRPHRWRRRLLIGAAVLVVVLVLAVVAGVKLQPAAPPLGLPAAPVRPPVGPVDGTWDVTAGSLAGFRVRESVLGLGNDVVGRTSAVTGAVVISRSAVTAATFRVALATIKVSGKSQPQLAKSLGTGAFPVATFTLTRAVPMPAGLASGSVVRVTARGQLELHGRDRAASVTISARRSGSDLQIAGSIPVIFARWGIDRPAGSSFLGSLADHGIAEFRLVLRA